MKALMQRREVIALIGAGVALPLQAQASAAFAQQPAIPVIGFIHSAKTAKALGLDRAADAARPRRRGDRMSAPGKAGAIQPVEVRPK